MTYRKFCLSMLLVLASACAAYANVDSQERALAEIKRLGGKVERDETAPGKPVVRIDLHGTKVADSDLTFLRKFRDLRALDLRLTQIGDEGVANI